MRYGAIKACWGGSPGPVEVGSPGEFHPRAPTDPYVKISLHTTLVTLITRIAEPRDAMPSA